MDVLIRLAEAWWPLYAVHFVEVSLFILVVWAVDRWMTLDTRLRYVLYLLALVKVFVPPFYAISLPEFLMVSDDVPIGPVYVDVVSGDEVVASAQAIPLSLAFYLFCLWTISVLVWAGVTLWKNAAFHRALRLAMPVDLAREVGLLNGTRDMKVYAKASLRSPLLVGIVKPRLYLPARWSSWSSEELRGVVAHEVAHRDNRDIWVLIFQAIAMALFCVNPLIWLLNRRLTFLRELRCDEAVLRETNLTPAEYGRLLFGFVDRRPALSALYFNEPGTALKKRLEYVLNFKEDNVKRSKWQLAIPILIGLAIVPFSIREAYTQDEGGLEVMELAEDEKKPEPIPEQQLTPPASDDDSRGVFMERVEVKLKQLMALYEETVKEKKEVVVNFKFMVNLDGSVSDVSILKGPEVFHQTVIDAVSQWRFKPGRHIGKVVAMRVTLSGRGDGDSDTRDKQQIKFALDSTEHQTTPPASGDADSSKVLEYGEVEVKPQFINGVTPVYPEKARKERIEGKVSLKLLVNVDGSVSDVSVLKGPEIFRQAAIDAISQSRFKPAEHNGKVVPVWMVMPIEFSLGSTDTDLQLTSPVPIDADGNEVEVPEFFEVEAKPELLQSVKSVYPPRVTVRLELKVNGDGSVSDVKVLKGPEEFHQAAIDAVSQYRFKPGTLNGKVVPVRMQQAIIFRLPKQQTTPPASGDADSSKVLAFYMVEVKPKVLHAVVKPVHPEEAIRDSLEGKVFLKFIVNVDGSVSDVRVLRGSEVFYQAAIDAALQFQFKPAEHNGKVVPVWMTQPISFRLPKQQSTPPASGDADSSKVLEFYMVEVKPKVLHSVKPMYPEEAIRDSLEGKVFLKFIVNVDGSVSDVKVLRGKTIFHKAAMDAVSQCRFKPAEHNGKVVPVWMTQPLSFRLPKQQSTSPASGDADSSKVLEFFMVEVRPKLMHAVEPIPHPEEALRDSLEGKVFVKFIVNVDGSVSDVRVLRGLGVFHQAAIDAISQFRYIPAEHNGKPVAVWMTQPINFQLPKE